MLIPVETWTILSVDDERDVISYTAGVYCPLSKTHGGESQPCVSEQGMCEYFHHADPKGIECIYNEVETDVIDGQTIDDEE